MTCRRYERMLFLYRQGELGKGDARALRDHLAGCKRCGALAAALEGDDRRLEQLRLAPPLPADPPALTARVMRGVDRESMHPAPLLSRFLDRIIDLTERPTVRYAAAGFVCTVTAAFLVQQATLFMSVWDLEQRVAARSGYKPSATLVYSVEPKGLEEVEELRPALDHVMPAQPAGGTLAMTTEAVRSYAPVLRELALPMHGGPLRTRIDRATLERMLHRITGSISVSVMFQTSEG